MSITRIITIIVALVLLYLVFNGVQPLQTLEAISATSPFYLLLALVVILFQFPVRAVRWHYLLSPMVRINWYQLFKLIMVSFAAGNITATGLGTFPRIIPLIKRHGVDRDFALGTVGAEIALDVGALAVAAMLVSSLSPVPSSVRLMGLVFAFALTAGIILVFRYFRWLGTEDHFTREVRRVPEEAKGIQRIRLTIRMYLRDVIAGLVLSLSKPGVMVRVLPLTAVIWITEATWFYLVSIAMDLQLPFFGAATAMVSTHVIIGLPSAPGFVGTLEAAASVALIVLGIPRSIATAYALVVHAFLIIPSTLLGLYFWWRERIPLDVAKIKKELGY